MDTAIESREDTGGEISHIDFGQYVDDVSTALERVIES